MRGLMAAVLLTPWLAGTAAAVPPLVSGDVPTADKGHVECYLGSRYERSGGIERELPADELVYGASDRQEVTVEAPYLSAGGRHGFGDVVLGTKYQFLKEAERVPGVAASFEWKLDNGSQAAGLGSGAMDYDVRVRSQKAWGPFTGLVNVGYTFVGEPVVDGARQRRQDVLFASFAQFLRVAPRTELLSEVTREGSDTPGEPASVAANVGFRQRLFDGLEAHATVGKSLREGNAGGPKLRVFAGVKLEFAVWEPRR